LAVDDVERHGYEVLLGYNNGRASSVRVERSVSEIEGRVGKWSGGGEASVHVPEKKPKKKVEMGIDKKRMERCTCVDGCWVPR
jgi:hypothetical protein